ncbi:hypothetical protein MMPV_005415 [Pyropia vietnamensis]
MLRSAAASAAAAAAAAAASTGGCLPPLQTTAAARLAVAATRRGTAGLSVGAGWGGAAAGGGLPLPRRRGVVVALTATASGGGTAAGLARLAGGGPRRAGEAGTPAGVSSRRGVGDTSRRRIWAAPLAPAGVAAPAPAGRCATADGVLASGASGAAGGRMGASASGSGAAAAAAAATAAAAGAPPSPTWRTVVAAWRARTFGAGRVAPVLPPRAASLLGNASFVLVALSFLSSDMLTLRALNISASVMMLAFNAFALERPVWLALRWGALFVAINAVHIGVLLRERTAGLAMPGVARDAYDRFFRGGGMCERAFMRLVDAGAVVQLRRGDQLTAEGEPNGSLWLVTDGAVRVVVEGVVVARGLTAGSWVGERGFLRGQTLKSLNAACGRPSPAAATVQVESDRLTAIRWSRSALLALFTSHPSTRAAVTLAITEDLLRKSTAGVAAVAAAEARAARWEEHERRAAAGRLRWRDTARNRALADAWAVDAEAYAAAETKQGEGEGLLLSTVSDTVAAAVAAAVTTAAAARVTGTNASRHGCRRFRAAATAADPVATSVSAVAVGTIAAAPV